MRSPTVSIATSPATPFTVAIGAAVILSDVESINYHLQLTPAQLKITHTALRSLLDDFGHEEHDVGRLIHEVLDKLPDEHSIRAIVLDNEKRRAAE